MGWPQSLRTYQNKQNGKWIEMSCVKAKQMLHNKATKLKAYLLFKHKHNQENITIDDIEWIQPMRYGMKYTSGYRSFVHCVSPHNTEMEPERRRAYKRERKKRLLGIYYTNYYSLKL